MLFDPNDIIIELLREILSELEDMNRYLKNISFDISSISTSID